MFRINPENKLKSLPREMLECSLNINNFTSKTEDELEILFKKIENSGKYFSCLSGQIQKLIINQSKV